jgi:molecular chaperone GrpE
MPDETISTENNEQAALAADAAEIENLRKLAAERDQYLDMAQRTRAEFENYQKRARKEREDERRYLNFAFAFDLLPVLDNLERALQAAQQAGDTGALAQGVALVQTQFLEQLKRHGVTPIIDAQGKPFDPNLHQAVMQQPSDQVEPNTVLQALERGYTIHDRVLRPTKVIVSSKP